MNRYWCWLGLALALQVALGCDNDSERDDDAGHEQRIAPATGAVCDDSLRYADDIKPIVERYCTRCHSSELPSSARMGAPADHNFDSEEGLLEVALHIDREAGSGPRQTNTVMPPSGAAPSRVERATLSTFLACHL